MFPPLVDGQLASGRWACGRLDAEAFAALPDARHRSALWEEWVRLTDAMRDAVGEVAAAWLSGSYFTDKEQPGDIDCVYVIRHERLAEARADMATAQFLQSVIGPGARQVFGLRVDTYFLDWWPRPGVKRGSDDRRRGYLEDRGYWDDLWSRTRDTDLKIDAVPQRGYLEVILDGYR